MESNGGLKYENLIFSWKYIVRPIKWLEISPGIWILNQKFKIDTSLRSISKYTGKSLLFIQFCKNFQGKFFFKGQHQFSTMNCTYSYKSLLSGIFFNSYPIKAHCVMVDILAKIVVWRPNPITRDVIQMPMDYVECSGCMKHFIKMYIYLNKHAYRKLCWRYMSYILISYRTCLGEIVPKTKIYV